MKIKVKYTEQKDKVSIARKENNMDRIEYLKRKEEVCPLDKEELYELQKGEEDE